MRKKKNVQFLSRMVFSYTLMFSVILLLIFGLLYFILVVNSENEARLNNQMLVAQPLKQLDRFISEMDNMAYNVMINEELIRKFSALRVDGDPENHFDKDILDNIDTGSILTTINGRFSPVWRISVYNDKGDFLSSGALVDREVVNQVLGDTDVASTMDWFRTSEEAHLLYRPRQDGWSNYFKSNYVTLTRPIMNAYSRDVVGLVDVQQNQTVLENYLAFAPERTLYLNIYDENGDPVLVQGGADDVVVATTVSDDYNWTIQLLEPRSAKNQERLRLLGMMASAWLLLTLIIYMVISLISRRISKPLTDLTNAVRDINITSPQKIQAASTEIDEIVALEKAFNTMLETLTFSLEQEKRSFLLAMQAQMNPHFLYNVLSVINAVALEKKSDTVVKICGNLSSMLRYSSSYVKGSATIAEELEQTKAYLELMKARYDYMFHYTIHMDEALGEVPIPKLVIQPLCENAFRHAFYNMEPPYRLDIRVETVDSGWRVRVTDNGVGFSPQARQQMMDRTNLASYEDLAKMQIGGLGLVSSVVRLKLFTRQQVTCDIVDVDPKGSSVSITVKEFPSEHHRQEELG